MADSNPLTDRDTKRATLNIAGGIALYILFGLLLWMLLNAYIEPNAITKASQKATVKKELIQALGFIMAGLAGAVGIIISWRNLQQAQANLRLTQEGMKQTQEGTQESLQLTREQLQLSREDGQLSRESQITERFTRATDQLGATDADGEPQIETRLGAIYTLERIARDSERDYWPIMELFTAYIRHNAPWPPKKDSKKDFEETPNNTDVGESEVSPSTEIQAILRVLWRRGRHRGKGEDYGLNLIKVDLRGGIIGVTHLEGALLRNSNLKKAFLEGAHMQQAYLLQAHLQGAHLQGANLQEAHLQGANLQDAEVTDEQLADTLSLKSATMPDGSKHT